MVLSFPSPLEVYRFISKKTKSSSITQQWFPSPLEVYRFISRIKLQGCFKNHMFPSPLEVYRFISVDIVNDTMFSGCFRPLSRYIGLYQAWNLFNNDDITVSVPSRGI